MITLERARLVQWHYFDDVTIEIGNHCLFAGDNGSGKSTIIDAIQYAMAADLRKTRFNAAAGDRKGGRDLAGYVRCKLGSDTTEYLRDDAVSHVMLEFSDDKGAFSAGVCAEAFADGRALTEHFWLGKGVPIASVPVSNESGVPFSFRQFRDAISGRPVTLFDSKRQYLRDFTAKLGVWRRMAEYNPYLEAFTRSVGFTPIVSVDQFVCDYILDDRPVDISAMKQNLESYKEAEREANATVKRITALTKITAKAAEWQGYEALILKQEYLRLRVDRDLTAENRVKVERRLSDLDAKHAALEADIAALDTARFDWDYERQELDAALAANDAHQLYRRIEERIGRLKMELRAAQKTADEYALRRSQVEALLDRPLSGNPDADITASETDERESREAKETAAHWRQELAAQLQDALGELADLEKGRPRYHESPVALKQALETAGITAHFLADTAEVTDADWADAAEGWLNTQRFAVLVSPDDFQKALEIYDALPRSVAGAFLPNLAKMRDAPVRDGSLAKLISADSPYARIYVDFILGNVMCADIHTLKTYNKAVTKECMTYSSHTASRIREEVYRRHYLGQRARKERAEFLLAETLRLRHERDEAAAEETRDAEQEEIFRRAYRELINLAHLLPAVADAARLTGELANAESELANVDTSSFDTLQRKKAEITERIHEGEARLGGLNRALGETAQSATENRAHLAEILSLLEQRESALHAFAESHPADLAECEQYAAERIGNASSQTLTTLEANYDSASKGFITKRDKAQKEYHALVQAYDRDFNALLSVEPQDSGEAKTLLDRLEMSELPAYREKIAAARADAEREFKDHFISRLNEFIEEARESFHEINETLCTLNFGRDQYRFTLEERSDRKGQIEIIRIAADITAVEGSLFAQFAEPGERKAAEDLFNRILNTNLDSPELRSICDYRTYFHYDIKIRDTEKSDPTTGKVVDSSLSKVLREKSGGEAQTPYYVAIAASFYRFYKNRPDETVRLVMFDEAFNRMDDERIGKILQFYRELNLQVIAAVPTEKIEAIMPYMERTNLVIRHGYSALVRDFLRKH